MAARLPPALLPVSVNRVWLRQTHAHVFTMSAAALERVEQSGRGPCGLGAHMWTVWPFTHKATPPQAPVQSATTCRVTQPPPNDPHPGQHSGRVRADTTDARSSPRWGPAAHLSWEQVHQNRPPFWRREAKVPRDYVFGARSPHQGGWGRDGPLRDSVAAPHVTATCLQRRDFLSTCTEKPRPTSRHTLS